jgi:hypothetical protein
MSGRFCDMIIVDRDSNRKVVATSMCFLVCDSKVFYDSLLPLFCPAAKKWQQT